ncbi:hypothetical protein BURC_00696 [Burkholderiaceae bacterium]|nr:hypothetical protein BURC_00696 [Burkholderiaceae bacterium]
MDKLIYSLCAMTAAAAAVLLLRSYLRTRFRLLLWSGLCFAGLTVNNVLLVLDRVVFTAVDLSTWRLAVALASVLLLLYGLIMEGGS